MNNISAFPQNIKIVAAAGQELYQGFQGGMTLRDYFAAKALQGFIARGGHYDCDFDASRAYTFADAMMEARNAAQ